MTRGNSLFIPKVAVQLVLLVLASSSLLALRYAAATWFGVSVAMIIWGGSAILDYAVRGRSFHDPRFGTLLMVAGFGSLVVGAVAMFQ
jgi:hypothetical protein